MSEFNRISSPMRAMEENLDDTDAIRQKKIEFIKLRELTKSPYSIGSVNDIDKKVSKLEEQIKGYQTALNFDDSDSESNLDNSYQSVTSKHDNRTERKEIEKFAGVFSIVSTVAFNKPDRIKKIAKTCMKSSKMLPEKSENQALPKFIELCQHPGFSANKMTGLPCLVDIPFILTVVYKAQPLSLSNRYRKFFEKWFYCQGIENILKDLFWYFFISRYGSDLDKKDLVNYFSRAASSYANFLFKIAKEPLFYQDKFKKTLPNLLSQTLYASLSECFPDSWVQFGDEFIEHIIQLVFFWFAGVRPTKGLWHNWNLNDLKPTEQKLKEKAINDQSVLGYTDKEIYKHSSDSNSVKLVLYPKSTCIGPLNDTNNVLFNLSGKSPLIQHYLQENGRNVNTGTSYLIKHKEILPKMTNNVETYADVVSNSLENIKQRGEVFKKFHEQGALETKRFIRLQKVNNASNENRQQKLLMNKSKVHYLSNLMMHEYLKDKNSISFGSDKAIADAIMSME